MKKIAKAILDRFPRISSTLRYIRDSRALRHNASDSVMGFKFLGNQEMIEGRFEPEETAIVICLMEQVDTVINIGANIGYYSCIALQHGKETIAFEPIRLNIDYLLKNIRSNSWDSCIEVYPIALSNRTGVVPIYGGGTGASFLKGWAGTSPQLVTYVPCSTLDIILGSRFSGKRCLILVDIEGAERLMLEGASLMINSNPRPIWLVEVCISEHQPDSRRINPNLLETFEIFWNSGYNAFTADSHMQQITKSRILEVIKTGVDNIGTHNFLFVDSALPKETFN